MADLILGIGTAHTPLVSEPGKFWGDHGASDLRRPETIAVSHGGGDVDKLVAERGERLRDEVLPEKFLQRFQQAQDGVSVLQKTFERVRPDVVVVVGDDQEDLYLFDYMPAMSIYTGQEIVNPQHITSGASEWAASFVWGYRPTESAETYPCEPDLATHLVKSLIGQEFDMAYIEQPAEGRLVGHAFTFVERRIFNDMDYRPTMVPFMLNTYYPPNQPTAGRCFELGEALRKGIASWDSNKTVALVASGGLSHPIVDEELDRGVIDAMKRNDADALTSLDEHIFRQGTSEIKNWITVAGAMAGTDFQMELIDYIPGYRSLAGTGCGMTFAQWE